ncbi:MAG TPA: threonine--tRNA ligase [Thermoleophilia bacterium]|nr:threonine--tRNA ligase [Thermoleophilia bacterium]
MTLHVTLPDGSPLELDDGASVRDAAAAIGPRLAKAAIAGRVTAADDPDVTLLVDAAAPLHDGDRLDIVTLKGEDPDAVDIQRHTASHVMAQAIVRLFPGAKYAIGPTIENGFYYDLQLPEPIAEADLARIEKEMGKVVSQNLPVERYELPVDEALAVFGAGEPGTGASGLPLGLDQPFKIELIEDLVTAAEATGDEVPTISVYRQGDFVDLCRGPHLPSTNKLGNGTFKLTSLAGAYWRGDEKNPMLTRVYGTAFPSKEELAAHLEALELARQRDHRRIGRDLDLFSFHEEGPGFPFFHPKGMRLWNAMIDYWRAEHVRAGYEEISTPVILRRELWERSGHWDNYKENMYFTEIDEQPYAVKPMNCPGGLLIYKSRRRSYRDLPLRMAELGRVHRHEMSGVLHGLFRVRYFTQDDAHIYCTPEQLEDEVRGVLHFMLHIYAAFGFSDVKIELSTKPEKSIGSDEVWELAEGVLARVLEGEGTDYVLNPGDGAFYGPKIDFHIRDVMGRTWQCGTIQVDFAMPERLDITYTGADNEEHRPVMIHRALLGSIERFMGILLEHYGGNLPTWLAPEQALVLPIADRHGDYAHEVLRALRAAGAGSEAEAPVTIHAGVDDRGESIGKRIRDAQLQKVPYILVVGDREVDQGAVGVRERGEDKGARPLAEFVDDLVAEVRERRLPGQG